MHLVGPYMTTTKYNRKTKKSKNKRQLAAEAEHDKWLRKKGVHPDQLAERKKPNINTIPDYREGSRGLPTSDKICGHGPAKEGNVYSGERQLLGIATMHKSNMVPVFADKKEDAKDIASMRR
jgi:hypothetical protein